MSEWQPIETAPKDGTDILICDISAQKPRATVAHFNGRLYVGCSKDVLSECVVDADDVGYYWPTHWMPLPEPPKP